MSSPFTFADLETPEAQSLIRARIVANLAADGQPTASWMPSSAGGAENLRADMVSGGLASLVSARVALLARGHLLETATDDPNTGYYLTYYAGQFYKLTPIGATYTVINVALTMAATGSAQTFSDGGLVFAAAATGNRYRLSLPAGQTVSIQPGQTVNAPFRAVAPGSSYADPTGTVTQLVSGPAGLAGVNQPATNFRATRSVGAGTGQVTGAFAAPGYPLTSVPYLSVRVRMDSSGGVGTATFSISIDGGRTWQPGGVASSAWHIPAGGWLTFSAGTYNAGSIFTLRVEDSFIARGRDAETPAQIRARCRDRWPSLSLVPTRGKVELWAWTASQEAVRVLSDADVNVPGGILVTLSAQTGPATPAAQDAVEDFIRARLGFQGLPAAGAGFPSPAETCQVDAAPPLAVTAAATVVVPAGKLAAVQAGADEAWQEYLATVALGGQPGAVVELEAFWRILGDLGAVDVQGLTLNGAAADLVVPAGYVAVPAPNYTLLTGLTWVTGGAAAPPAPAVSTPIPGAPFTSSPQSSADLVPPLSIADVKAFLLAYLSVPANPVDDWESGAILRTYWELEGLVITSLTNFIQKQAASSYPGEATGASLAIVARGFYGQAPGTPTPAAQSVNVTCDAQHGPYTAAQVATLVGMTSDGALYAVTAGAAILGTGATITLTFTAQAPGAARAIITAVSGLPGVGVSGAAITVFGSDAEADGDVRAAIDSAWPDLEEIPEQDRTATWALAAAPPPLITRYRIDSGTTYPGQVMLTLANAGGPVSGGTLTAVQAALDKLSPITDNNTAQNSTTRTITPSGTITVRASLLAQAQAQADAAWAAYISGSQIGAVIYLEALRQIVGDAIAADPLSNFTGEALAGAGGDGNVALAPTEVPIASGPLSAALTWEAT